MPQPKAGSICRSPGAVARMIQMDCWISVSPETYGSPPRGVTRIGNPQPVPSVFRFMRLLVHAFGRLKPLPQGHEVSLRTLSPLMGALCMESAKADFVFLWQRF